MPYIYFIYGYINIQMNMFLVKTILDVDVNDMQVMLFDKFSDGPYHELIQKAFSPKHPVIRHTHYKGKV